VTIGTSIVLVAIGAILKWAVSARVNGFNIQTAGTVVFVVGLVGLALSIMYTFWWSASRREVYDDTRVVRRPPPNPPPTV
jgi:nitrogen fixation-related uncharacterized protein